MMNDALAAQIHHSSFCIHHSTAGGEGGIRTHGTVSRTQHFQCCQFSHSCTSPIQEAGGRKQGDVTASWLLPPASLSSGGEGGIRTHGTLAGTTVFETARFSHSRTSPYSWPCAFREKRIVSSRGKRRATNTE